LKYELLGKLTESFLDKFNDGYIIKKEDFRVFCSVHKEILHVRWKKTFSIKNVLTRKMSYLETETQVENYVKNLII